MTTRDELKTVMRKIKIAYKDKFIIDSETVDLWHEHLQNHEREKLEESAHRHIDNSTYPPTIADINLGAVAIEEEEARIKRDIMNNWRNMASLHYLDDSTTKLFERAVFSQPREKWRECGRYLTREVAAHDRELAEDVIRRVAGL